MASATTTRQADAALTDEQQDQWLTPLLEGEIRSCFSMTEPETSGSDPTGLRGRAELDGDEWVIDAHKWFTSGAVGAAVLLAGEEQVPEPIGLRALAQLDEDARVGNAGADLLVQRLERLELDRVHVLVEEGGDAPAQLLDTG